jgi:hypothetical protein
MHTGPRLKRNCPNRPVRLPVSGQHGPDLVNTDLVIGEHDLHTDQGSNLGPRMRLERSRSRSQDGTPSLIGLDVHHPKLEAKPPDNTVQPQMFLRAHAPKCPRRSVPPNQLRLGPYPTCAVNGRRSAHRINWPRTFRTSVRCPCHWSQSTRAGLGVPAHRNCTEDGVEKCGRPGL